MNEERGEGDRARGSVWALILIAPGPAFFAPPSPFDLRTYLGAKLFLAIRNLCRNP